MLGSADLSARRRRRHVAGMCGHIEANKPVMVSNAGLMSFIWSRARDGQDITSGKGDLFIKYGSLLIDHSRSNLSRANQELTVSKPSGANCAD